MRLRRSLLFACGADPAALAAAPASGADTLILDLEDTVTPDRKPEARRLVAEHLRAATGGPERAVRVNAVTTGWLADDVAVVVASGAHALVVPKVESADDLRAVDALVTAAEREHRRPAGSVRLLALVETPRGVLAAPAVAGAAARLDALVIGHVDLARALGIREAGASGAIMLHARCQVVLAAKAAGREAIDAVFMDVADADGFRAEAREGLALGFAGKLVIDARQVALVHAVWAPSAAEVDYARRLVATFEAARAAGTGVFVFEGRVIDLPVVEAERAVLRRAAAATPPG